jgi:hypothetical protein
VKLAVVTHELFTRWNVRLCKLTALKLCFKAALAAEKCNFACKVEFLPAAREIDVDFLV